MLIRVVLVLLLGSSLSVFGQGHTLPKRLVLCLDGISWRDVKALQEGLVTDQHGRKRNISAFTQGYYPVSRLVSTFPSCSAVAWTEMFDNPPLPGYQHSYFDISANRVVAQNGITTITPYQHQMHWQTEDGWQRALGYILPMREFKREVREFIDCFMRNSAGVETFYAMLFTTDDAQHMSADIFRMLELLDNRLQDLQVQYRASTGHDLEILILSDHGNNHAGPGKRFPIVPFLKQGGYRITKSIHSPRDIVLFTAGMQAWVGIYNTPAETSNLVTLIGRVPGVDLITYRDPGGPNQFGICNPKGDRATITYDPARKRYRYALHAGDPLEYQSVLESLRQRNALDQDGFASAEDWLAASIQHRYPVALERIARGHTDVTRNPANILISLDNRYVHASFWVFHGSRLVTCGGTHGGLDDLASNGIILSNFTPTCDMTTTQLARQFAYFPGRNQSYAQAKKRQP